MCAITLYIYTVNLKTVNIDIGWEVWILEASDLLARRHKKHAYGVMEGCVARN
jgi:hypothetical protein